MVDDDPFRIENLQLRIEEPSPAQNGAKVAKPRRRHRDFVMVTRAQSDRLDKAVHFATEVFRHLLFMSFKAGGRPVRLANAALVQKGIHRKSKRRALLELEALGLIQVGRRPRKSPEVIILILQDGNGGGTQN